jgi:hypothetical protein
MAWSAEASASYRGVGNRTGGPAASPQHRESTPYELNHAAGIKWVGQMPITAAIGDRWRWPVLTRGNVTIDFSFQALNATTTRLGVPARLTPSSTLPASFPDAPAARDDRLTLSAEAEATAGTPGAAPATPAIDGRIGTLLGALDGDDNGSITAQEFTEAASALLRRPAPPQAKDEGRGRRGLPGLERRLEKAFDRIDGNGDGSVDATELATALGVAPPAPSQPAPAQPEPAPAPAAGVVVPSPAPAPVPHEPAAPSSGTTASWYSMTYVSIAVQRYTALQQAVAPDA